MNSNSTHIRSTTSHISWADRWDHTKARWAINRGGHRVEPGLYALGDPGPEAPVFVSANYTLSFDALRSSLTGIHGYILVLDTKGVNVWCAAGKGTFGTDELVLRIKATGLRDVVNHRIVILPQLGAPGVAAHQVKKRSGFKVEYGPVRASDLPAYLETRQATPEMRLVGFTLRDRMTLIPVELVHTLLPMIAAALVLYLVAGPLAAAGAVAAILSGVALFPVLLPWLPTAQFSTRGFLLGSVVALPFALTALSSPANPWWWKAGSALALLLGMPPVTAFLALNFTGSTTFTSRTGVRKEMFAYIPVMAWTFGLGLVLTMILSVARAVT